MLPKICRQRRRGSPRAGRSTRYAIERGDVSASVTVLGQIAEALGVEPGELLRRSSRKG